MGRNDTFLAGLITGAVIGAVAGLLLAPKSGKETREMLVDQGQRAGRYVGDAIRRRRGEEETSDDTASVSTR
ncbi:MAG: YtxH domain-containing protein [SAR202 cluster bacterium]|nr:YtxH domain-containing protein [SAR202 cluster bacterium]